MIRETDERFAFLQTGVTLVEVSGGGCAGCEALFPVLKRLEKSRGDFTLVRVEVEELEKADIEKWGIERIPTALLMWNGEIVARFSGYQPEEIAEIWLDAKLEELEKNKNKK